MPRGKGERGTASVPDQPLSTGTAPAKAARCPSCKCAGVMVANSGEWECGTPYCRVLLFWRFAIAHREAQ